MILDKLENAGVYASISPRLARGLAILSDESLSKKKDGRYEVEGSDIYYTVQRYTTKPASEGRLEAHRIYIDIQFIISGQEMLGYAPLDGLKERAPYDARKDIVFYDLPAGAGMVTLKAGMFAIFFPQDAHAPCLQAAGPENVMKIVVKVRTSAD